MRVVILASARDDMDAIYAWIAKDAPHMADAVVARLIKSMRTFGHFPYIGHEGIEIGTFEWPVRKLPYVILYRVNESSGVITVEAIFHMPRER